MVQDCASRQVTHSQGLDTKPDKPCPCCGWQHSFAGKGGIVLYATRLYHCIKFRILGTQARAEVLRTAEGCVLCNDWTGGHQKDACPYAARFQACGRDGCELFHPRVLHAPNGKSVNTGMVNHVKHHKELKAPSLRETRFQEGQVQGAALRNAESSGSPEKRRFAVEDATATGEAEPEEDVAAITPAGISASAEEAAEIRIPPGSKLLITVRLDFLESVTVKSSVSKRSSP